jgi:hypothetical protein
VISAAFSRDGDDLVITDVPGLKLWLPENALEQIVPVLRRTRGPESAYVQSPLLAVLDDITEVRLTIYAKAASGAALQALRDELNAAAGQWSYDLTLTISNVATTYSAEIARPVWSGFDVGMARVHMDRCQLVIPVSP